MKLSIKELKTAVVTAIMLSIFAVVFVFQNDSLAAAVAAGDGAATYKAKCASCHSADGSGTTTAGKAMKVRDLRTGDVQKQSDDQLFAVIAKGKNKMPGYEKTLGADKCKELVAHMRKLAGK